MPLDEHELPSLLELATHVARVGGRVAMRYYKAAEQWLKADGSIVTRADVEAEQEMTKEILRAAPHAQILGEELGGAADGVTGLQWVIDPIDGTSWYALGLPVFGVLVAVLVDREPVVGVIHCPALGETLSAASGGGCWLRTDAAEPRRVRIAPCESIAHATISVAALHATELGTGAVRIAPLARRCARLVTAGDCVQHVRVALGRVHVAIDPVMRPWDSAAIVPCIREAGGAVGSVSPAKAGVVFAGSLISATDRALLEHVTRAIQPDGAGS